MWVEGAKDSCSDSVKIYTVHDFPSSADFLNVQASAGNTVQWVDNNSKKFAIKFGNATYFTATVWVYARIYNLNWTVDTEVFTVLVSVSSPNPPNWGTIVVCPNGPNVNLTTNQGLNCGFHCDYVWTAPGGINLRYGGSQSSQITLEPHEQPVELLSSGLTTGHLGWLNVAAKWSECGMSGDTYGYAEIYSGTPTLNPRVNGSPSQGWDCAYGEATLNVDYPPGTYYVNWAILGGNGTINPNGATCHANPNNFLLIRVNEQNTCGTSEHYYYLSQCGYSAYRIAPNPTETEITIDFEFKEFAEGLLKRIELIDLEGKSIAKFQFKDGKDKDHFKNSKSFIIDAKKFKRGNYVLHLDFGNFIDKKQVILN